MPKRPFDSQLVKKWLSQLSLALVHCHDNLVLHRDLKAANVMLSASNDIKLGDFGVSRELSTHTHLAATVVGTPAYMAPEVLGGAAYAHPADVWSLGILCFEMLTLSRPFVGDNLAVLVSHNSSGKLTTPVEAALARSPHPPSLLRLVGPTMLLHTDPEKRLTLKALIEALATVDDVP